MTTRTDRVQSERTRKTLTKRIAETETAFQGFDRIFPRLKATADKARNDADRDALFRVHGMLRAELRGAEAALAEYEKETTP